MHATESRSISRAALLLFLVSLARWAAPTADAPAASTGADVLDALTESTRVATSDAQRRARPLADGERLDPNRDPVVELDRLPGVGPTTATAIVLARDSGIVFRRVDDLLSVRGIGPALLGKIRGHIDVSDPPARGSRRAAGGRRSTGRERSGDVGPRVDINRAGAEELQTLPGVGPALAERIAAARRERPFSSVDDLIRVPGIGPATVDRLRKLAAVGRSR